MTKGEATLCNQDRNTCVRGECTGSVCLRIGSTECQCTEDEDQLCHVCCSMDNVNGTTHCVSTADLVSLHVWSLCIQQKFWGRESSLDTHKQRVYVFAVYTV